MTREDIIRMAREAGLTERNRHSEIMVRHSNGSWVDVEQVLTRFARLVSTAERRKHQAEIERWKTEAATAEKWRGLALSKDGDGRCVQRIQQEAAAKEREACAALCDDMVQDEEGKLDRNYTREDTAEELAVLIRARGQQ